MRVVEALAAGLIVAVAAVVIAVRLDVDAVVVPASGFLVTFLAVVVRRPAGRGISAGRPARRRAR